MSHRLRSFSCGLLWCWLAAVVGAQSVQPGVKLPAEEGAWIEFEAGLERFIAGDDGEARAQWRHLQHFYSGYAQTFGTPVRALLADLDRRIKAGRGQPPPLALPAEFADWPAERRIAWLIHQFEEIGIPQQGSPAGVPLEEDWRVLRLIAEGEAAVPALIDAVEHDGRFTRSVHYWRDFVHQRTVLTVREAALVAVSSILRHSVYEPYATGDDFTSGGAPAGAAAAAQLRKYFARWSGLPFDQRMMGILTDPTSTAAAAREAAGNLASLGAADLRGTTVWTGGRSAGDPAAKRLAIAKFEHPTIAEAMVVALDRELAEIDSRASPDQRQYQRDVAVDQWTRLLAELGDARIDPELVVRGKRLEQP